MCRQECKKLREELREEHEEDKRAALTQLAQAKEQELGSARESWQRKVEDLLEQVKDITHTLQASKIYSHCLVRGSVSGHMQKDIWLTVRLCVDDEMELSRVKYCAMHKDHSLPAKS